MYFIFHLLDVILITWVPQQFWGFFFFFWLRASSREEQRWKEMLEWDSTQTEQIAFFMVRLTVGPVIVWWYREFGWIYTTGLEAQIQFGADMDFFFFFWLAANILLKVFHIRHLYLHPPKPCLHLKPYLLSLETCMCIKRASNSRSKLFTVDRDENKIRIKAIAFRLILR